MWVTDVGSQMWGHNEENREGVGQGWTADGVTNVRALCGEQGGSGAKPEGRGHKVPRREVLCRGHRAERWKIGERNGGGEWQSEGVWVREGPGREGYCWAKTQLASKSWGLFIPILSTNGPMASHGGWGGGKRFQVQPMVVELHGKS